MSKFERAARDMRSWEKYLRNSIDTGAPTADMIESHRTSTATIMSKTHKLDRGLVDLAVELDTNKKSLEEMFVGKSVLDIGCGTGRLAAEIARIKRTRVVALDHNPEMINRIPKMKNLTGVEGSGFDLAATIHDEQFDVVLSSFSSVLWARSEKEKIDSITSSIGATISGGTTLLVPVVSNPGYRMSEAERVTKSVMSGSSSINPHDALDMLQQLYVAGWYDLAMFDTLHGLEDNGQIQLDFATSRANRAGDQIQERYSAIATKL